MLTVNERNALNNSALILKDLNIKIKTVFYENNNSLNDSSSLIRFDPYFEK